MNKGFGDHLVWQDGFTLIELLIVIAVLGILSAVVLVAINPVQQVRRARDSQAKSDIGQIATALETYYTDYAESYPVNLISLSPNFLKRLPETPRNRLGGSYSYSTNAGTSEASLLYDLEAGGWWCYGTVEGFAEEEGSNGVSNCTPPAD